VAWTAADGACHQGGATKGAPTKSEPTDVFDALDDYATAVGRVVYEWNYLHEELGRLFVVVRNEDKALLLTKWWSCKTDAGQRTMLKDAVTNAPKGGWKKERPRAVDDLNWLLERVDELAEDRHNAVHAPVSPYFNADGSAEVMAAYLKAHPRHPRAEKLMGKDLLVEFAWCAEYATALSRFTLLMRMAILLRRYEWPPRPDIPKREDFSGASRRRS
jgi:hypothetical protein